MTERRKHRRIPVEHLMKARLTVGEVVSMGRIIDLNNAGAFVATDLDLEKGAELQVELELPGGEESLELRAVVARRIGVIEGKRHVIPAGLGIVFLTANVMERAFIQKAVLKALQESLRNMRSRASTERRPEENVPRA